jgi:hypothetical protein
MSTWNNKMDCEGDINVDDDEDGWSTGGHVSGAKTSFITTDN